MFSFFFSVFYIRARVWPISPAPCYNGHSLFWFNISDDCVRSAELMANEYHTSLLWDGDNDDGRFDDTIQLISVSVRAFILYSI